jgi:hypothetical protein
MAKPRQPLAGLTEIGKLLKMTRQGALRVTRLDGFPEPLDRIAAGPVWDQREVATWKKDNWKAAK